MAALSNRAGLVRSATLALSLAVINILLTFGNLWPTPAVRWNGELSVELAAYILLLVAVSIRRGPPTPRLLRWSAIVGVVLVLTRYADVTTPALYGRQVNLYWDIRYIPAVAAMLTRATSARVVIFALTAAVLIPLALYKALHGSLRRVGTAMTREHERRALALVAGAAVLLFGLEHLDRHIPGVPRFSSPVVWAYARQAKLAAGELASGRTSRIGPAPSFESDFSRVAGADVLLIFLESYGAVSFDRPEFAAGLAASRARFEADIAATGRKVVSAFVESPTFGGSSWLAHVSLLSGIEVRDQDTNVKLMAQRRDTLVTTFQRHGYRTLAIMPGMQEAWPEGVFYGFDEIYGEARLDYRGPPFGWWSVPDQFVIARMDALALNGPSNAPAFVFFPTTNTHTPFSPTPPYQPDWTRVLTDRPYDDDELERSWERLPNWLNLGPSYVQAFAAGYESLGGYLRMRAGRDFVMVLLGDHQPPAAVSGEGASWEVPVHVITSRKEVLDSLVRHGFREGLAPRHPALAKMNGLVPLLLSAFGSR